MNPAPNFEVGISGAMRERLVRLYRHAVVDGQGDEFLAALDATVSRLGSDPLTYGEELFDLRAMKVTVRIAVRYPLVIEFATFADRRQVFVRAARYIGPD
jgi:hypothetical protein